MKEGIKYALKNLATGVLAGLALVVVTTFFSDGKKISEPVLKQIGTNDAKVYYIKLSREIDGKEELDPGTTFVYIDERPYGSLDYVVTLEKRWGYNRATHAWSASQEDIDNFNRMPQ